MNERPSEGRILRIITRLNVGGPARQALMLSKSLEQWGFRSDLVFGSEGAKEGSFQASNVRHFHVPSLKRSIDPASDLRAAVELGRLIRSRAPHVVHTHLAKAGALGRLAAKRARVPVTVHTFHGHVLEGYFPGAANRALLAIERALAKRTDALIAVSKVVRDELLALGVGRPSQWHVIPVGLSLASYMTDDLDTEQARHLLGLPDGQLLVGIVGRLVPVKDVDTFLDASARVAARRSDVSFVVAGDGALRESLQRRAEDLLGHRAIFPGWVSNLAALYAALDVVVLSSTSEGTPTALVEAGAAARPSVATRVGGVPDIVLEGVTGSLVKPGDAEAIATATLRLLEDPGRRVAMGTAAREWVSARFTLERLSADLAALYGDLLARRGIDFSAPPDAG
jgi:glycosyltransferase involved in cell wall biosynthesis